MKRILPFLLILLLLCGCAPREYDQVAATTLPVWEFTSRLCQGTGIGVTRLVTESVSCLHDYSLNVRQVRAVEAAQLVVISGGGLEEFMEDILHDKHTVDASAGIRLLACVEEHGHDHDHGHSHDVDAHIWLAPENAMVMAENICASLCAQYPEHTAVFESNLANLLADLQSLADYGQQQLASLACRDLITFHDGFGYLAESFDLHILKAVEEESGSEPSAAELIQLIEEVEHHQLPAIFTEISGSTSAAGIIAAETGIGSYPLDMAMSGSSYFDAMYHNINTLKEALG